MDGVCHFFLLIHVHYLLSSISFCFRGLVGPGLSCSWIKHIFAYFLNLILCCICCAFACCSLCLGYFNTTLLESLVHAQSFNEDSSCLLFTVVLIKILVETLI